MGYAMINAVVMGQILSVVSTDGRLSVEVGIVIAAILTFLVTTFGIRIFHCFESCVIASHDVWLRLMGYMLGYHRLPYRLPHPCWDRWP